MSHADDGTLHAYLDGELSALEAVRLEAHLSECADCRRRLGEERGLVTRAGELLAAAVPPERAAPPLHQLRHPRPGRRARFPLAWAATLVLTVAVAWFVRLPNAPRTIEQSQQAARRSPANPPRLDSAPSTGATGAITSEETTPPARGEAAPPSQAQSVEPPPPPAVPLSEPAAVAARDAMGDVAAARPSPAPAARDAMGDLAAARQSAAPAARAATPDTASRDNAAVASRSAAPVRSRSADLGPGAQLYPGTISAADARTLLGADLVAVPGLRVLAIRRARLAGYSPVVVVEQALDSSGTIAVVHRRLAGLRPVTGVAQGAAPAFERRADTMALADSLAGVRLEIDVVGPLSPDSLSRLRAALQPFTRR